jgi:S-layer protein
VNAVGPNDLAWFQFAGNTYVVMDSVGGAGIDSTIFVNGEDLIVKLTGLIDLSLASFNDTFDTIAL